MIPFIKTEAAKATPPIIIETKPGPILGSSVIDHDKTLDPYAMLDPDESLSEMKRVNSVMDAGQVAHEADSKGKTHWATHNAWQDISLAGKICPP
jgi:hypothetical protein